MKQYLLTKTELFGIPVKKINYNFKVDETKDMKKPQYIIIHHTGNANTIQKIINSHVKKKHYTSIGYHLLIGKNGQVYFSRELNKVGAHTFGYNSKAIGIAIFGNFNKNEPSPKQLETLKKLIDIMSKELHIKEIMGHNQAVYKLLLKKEIAQLPEVDPIDIVNDIEYYSFLKKVDEKILETKNEEAIQLMNKLKTCPGINIYKPLKEILENN